MVKIEPNFFKQHLPTFCDGFERRAFSFSTTKELLNNPWIKGWLNERGFEDGHYCMSKNCLMVENKNETRWWVIGYIKYPEKVDIPKWGGGLL